MWNCPDRYFNIGHGRSFHEVPWNDGKGTVYGLAFVDFDGDGWPDIVAARSDAPRHLVQHETSRRDSR